MSENGRGGRKLDMAGEKFDMALEHSLHVRVACKLATSADRKRDEQLMSETLSRSKVLAQRAPKVLETDDKISTWVWQNSTCARHKKDWSPVTTIAQKSILVKSKL
jgi:hypothetical protein